MVSTISPDIICIQESYLTNKCNFSISNYCIFRRDRSDGNKGGGVAILLKKGIVYSNVTKYESIEAISISVKIGNIEVKLSNVYLPHGPPENLETLLDLFQERNSIVCGDFNAKHPLWGSRETDKWGTDLAEIIEDKHLVVINSGEGTRVDLSNNSKSHLDLTITSSNLAGLCNWEVMDDLCGSDHYVIKTSINENIQSENIHVPRWNFKKADWKGFELFCDAQFMKFNVNNDIEQMVQSINDIIIKASEIYIPKTKNSTKNPVPFWNDECDESIKERKKIRRKLEKSKNPRDYIEYKRKRAKVIRTIKDAKKNYWHSYCSNLSYKSDVRKVWNTVRGINNVGNVKSIPSIRNQDKAIFDTKEKCNIFAKHYAFVSSSNNYTQEFKDRKNKFETEHNSLFQSHKNDNEPINEEIQLSELIVALDECKKVSAPGIDDINYIMIKHLSNVSLKSILQVFNVIWKRGEIPAIWKHAVVIPILKPGKDESLPISYRPISLTSNLCKLFEKIISKRLYSHFEKYNLFNINQSGFRKNRRTLDHLIRISEDIHKSLATKGYTVGVFLDIEKAYDMVWRKGVLFKLHKLGVSGNMFNWVNSFLHNRKIQVRLGNVLSEEISVENGTPQGSVISPLLFLIAINDLAVDEGINLSLFADDSAIWKCGRNLKYLEGKLQNALNKINDWANEWGFKVSIEKTQVVIFTRKRNKTVELKYNDITLKVVKKVKFLGLIFDSKLSWRDHIKFIVEKCTTRVNLLRCIAGNNWGANKENLVYVFKALIRSRIEYGCEVYGSANKRLLHCLDVIQNKCLRVCTGALRVTSIEALEVDCGVMPLDLRRQKLQARIIATYLDSSNNPVKSSLQESWHSAYSKNKYGFKPILTRVTEFLNGKDIIIPRNVPLPFPKWHIARPYVDLTLNGNISKSDPEIICKVISLEFINSWVNYLHVYTDGSKEDKYCTAAFYVPEFKIQCGERLEEHCNNFEGELVAILKALIWIYDKQIERTVIFSDSLSALQSIRSLRDNGSCILKEIFYQLYQFQNSGLEVTLAWIPSHVGIPGNEIVDKIAKDSHKKPITVHVPKIKKLIESDIDNEVINIWQDRWDLSEKGRFYYNINPSVNEKTSFSLEHRYQEVQLTRLRFGDCWLNNVKALMGKSDSDLCSSCLVRETVEHFLLECVKHFDLSLELTNTLLMKGIDCSIYHVLREKVCLDIIWKYIEDNNICL